MVCQQKQIRITKQEHPHKKPKSQGCSKMDWQQGLTTGLSSTT